MVTLVRQAIAVQAESCGTCRSSQFNGLAGDYAEWFVGGSDFATFGVTAWARKKAGHEKSIDSSSGAYNVGAGSVLVMSVLGLGAAAYDGIQILRGWRAQREAARLLATSAVPYAAGEKITKAARELSKHPSVIGLTKSNFNKVLNTAAQQNSAAEMALKGMLAGSRSVRHHKDFGKVIEFRNAAGYGARFEAKSGKFIGFLSP